mmetsp:Transcript_3837/g.11074  ORF Transcript_3837/g.11074 Transcript_3837/m.11074 type:complete len:371 (+) Transcript_3837:137-1249(+)
MGVAADSRSSACMTRQGRGGHGRGGRWVGDSASVRRGASASCTRRGGPRSPGPGAHAGAAHRSVTCASAAASIQPQAAGERARVGAALRARSAPLVAPRTRIGDPAAVGSKGVARGALGGCGERVPAAWPPRGRSLGPRDRAAGPAALVREAKLDARDVAGAPRDAAMGRLRGHLTAAWAPRPRPPPQPPRLPLASRRPASLATNPRAGVRQRSPRRSSRRPSPARASPPPPPPRPPRVPAPAQSRAVAWPRALISAAGGRSAGACPAGQWPPDSLGAGCPATRTSARVAARACRGCRRSAGRAPGCTCRGSRRARWCPAPLRSLRAGRSCRDRGKTALSGRSCRRTCSRGSTCPGSSRSPGGPRAARGP